MQVLNRDDPRSLALAIPGRLVDTFGAGVPESEEAWGLVRAPRARGSRAAARCSSRRPTCALVGRHNALNALAALALVSTVAKIDRRVLAALTTFEGLPHRMQRVVEVGRRALRQRLQGHDGRRDAGRARRLDRGRSC